jgi:hypothetical protein
VITDADDWRGALLLRSGVQAVLYLPARCTTPGLAASIRECIEEQKNKPQRS